MRSFPININKKSVLSERIFFRKKGILEKKDGYQYGLEPGMKLLKKSEGIWCGRADLLRIYDR